LVLTGHESADYLLRCMLCVQGLVLPSQKQEI
jgi:hypothetical protein